MEWSGALVARVACDDGREEAGHSVYRKDVSWRPRRNVGVLSEAAAAVAVAPAMQRPGAVAVPLGRACPPCRRPALAWCRRRSFRARGQRGRLWCREILPPTRRAGHCARPDVVLCRTPPACSLLSRRTRCIGCDRHAPGPLGSSVAQTTA